MDVNEYRLEFRSKKDAEVGKDQQGNPVVGKPEIPDSSILDGFIENFANQSKKLYYLERMLDFEIKLSDFLLETLIYLEDTTITPDTNSWDGAKHERMQTILIPEDLESMRKRRAYITSVNMQMRESVQNTSSFLKNQLHQCECHQKRASDSLDYVNAVIARMDNQYNKQIAFESKQDSTSMMTISILTMALLPATLVAAIFSMSMFDWQQPMGAILSPHFWIYWVVVIPLTGLATGAWVVWFKYFRKPGLERREKLVVEEKQNGSNSATPPSKQQRPAPDFLRKRRPHDIWADTDTENQLPYEAGPQVEAPQRYSQGAPPWSMKAKKRRASVSLRER